MADIYFSDYNMGSLMVTEKPEQVCEAIREADGMPIVLTRRRPQKDPVYVNPNAIAYWD